MTNASEQSTPHEFEWELSNVSFRHHEATCDTLTGLTISIEKGMMTTIVGPNGAGKSTLIHLLLGILKPRTGTVSFRGRSVHACSRLQLSREIGVVPQGEAEPAFTVRDTVAMGRYPHLGPWQRERLSDIQAIETAMEQCNVTAFASRHISTLSGGERQRVRVARALAQQTRVIVLDEPTAALDIRHEMELFEQFASLRKRGVTIVLVTHNLNLAARYSDRIVLLESGMIAANGSPDEVITSTRIGGVYQWPVDVIDYRGESPQVIPMRRDECIAPSVKSGQGAA